MRLRAGWKTTTGGFMAVCPFHLDTVGSLKLETETGRWYCHGCPHGGGMVELEMKLSGCNAKTAVLQIADILGRRDLIRPVGKNSAEQNFNYSDENGELLYQIRRYKNKKFGAYRADPTGSGWKKNMIGVRRVPYRLPEVIKARVVIVNEGEKHCDRCKQLFPESEIAATVSPVHMAQVSAPRSRRAGVGGRTAALLNFAYDCRFPPALPPNTADSAALT